MSHCSSCQHRSQDGGWWKRTHAWELFINLLGEQDVRGKYGVLQVKSNLVKDVVARTVNNQTFLLELFWIWIRSEKCLFCPRPISLGLGPALVSDNV